MKIICVLLLLTVIVGCGSNQEGASQSPSQPVVAPEPSQPSKAASPEPVSSPEPSPEPSQELTDSEQLALDYFTVFLNGSDLEAKKKFVDDHVHAGMQGLVRVFEGAETPEKSKFLNPKYVDSVDFKDKGKKYSGFLFTGQLNAEETEMIVLQNEGKIVWIYSPSSDPKKDNSFKEFRALFK